MMATELPLARVLIIAPHPDDDVIATAGLMQKSRAAGGEIRVLFVTDGENNGWPQRALERRLRLLPVDRRRWGALRRSEAEESLVRLGLPRCSAVFLGFPDRKIAALLRCGDDALQRTLEREMERFRPMLIVSPSKLDRHPDHIAIASFAERAAAETSEEATLFVTYVIHGPGDPSRLCAEIGLSACEQEHKRAAIACHASQLFLSRRRFLSYASVSERFYREERDLALPTRSQMRMGWLRHVLGAIFGTLRRSPISD
jgi:N-acetyl-1-D-myo-inositol-2-amino-2-deoxy-alpha-D-glucopyranoside deacetylase